MAIVERRSVRLQAFHDAEVKLSAPDDDFGRALHRVFQFALSDERRRRSLAKAIGLLAEVHPGFASAVRKQLQVKTKKGAHAKPAWEVREIAEIADVFEECHRRLRGTAGGKDDSAGLANNDVGKHFGLSADRVRRIRAAYKKASLP